MAHNMYRVGDFVYFEVAPGAPYQIRKIEELNKINQSGAVEAKVTCYYRRRDILPNLLQLADKHSGGSESKEANGRIGQKGLNEIQSHRVRHRELFVSRQVETLPATHIRGKCVVSLLNETESQLSYLQKDDAFFYSLKYDPAAKTLLADRGEIRIGPNYQAVIPDLLSHTGEKDPRDEQKLAELEWCADNKLQEDKVDEFWLLARSVGTMARAYDCTSSVRQPNLLMSAAAASRDATHLRALQVLHRSGYDFNKAVSALVPSRSPLLCRDEMEEWSASEGNLFEEAMDKYGKNFHDIRNDFLPWKTYPALVEYYYMWKTTDRYVQQKRLKAAEADTRLKQVYIPAYSRPSPAAADVGGGGGARTCECCDAADCGLWVASDDANGRNRVCLECWNYWKKYGGMKFIMKSAEPVSVGSAASGDGLLDSGGPGAIAASPLRLGRAATFETPAQRGAQQRSFLFQSNPSLRVARRLCRDAVRHQRLTRRPFRVSGIDGTCLVEQYEAALSARSGKSPSEVHDELVGPLRSAGPVAKGQLLQGTVRRLQGGRDLGKWVPRPPLALYTKSIKRRLAPVRSPEPVHQPQRKKEDEVDRPKKTARVDLNGLALASESGTKVRRVAGRLGARDGPQKVGGLRRHTNGDGEAGASVTDYTMCEIYVVSDVVRKVRRNVARACLRKLTRQPFLSIDDLKSAPQSS